jgi:O-antigen/teichoic acid export membrane protein
MVQFSPGRRILAALIGNGFARGVRVAEQLFLIPILLAAWGASLFGEWTALTSIASFAYLVNLGIGQAALSDIVLRYSSGDRQGASRSFTTAIILITLAVAFGFAALSAAVQWFGVGVFTSGSVTARESRLVVLIFGFALLVNFYAEPLTGAISAVLGLHVPNSLSALTRLLEICSIAIAVQFSAGPVTVAIIILATNLLNLLLMSLVAWRSTDGIALKLRHFDLRALQRTWRASLGFFVIVVCMTFVYMQVPRLLVFHYFGAAALAGFTVFVTYTRIGRTLASIMAQSAQVEIGRAFGAGEMERFRRLIETVLGTALGLACVISMAALVAAPLVLPVWTRGEVVLDWQLLIALAMVAVIGSYFDAALACATAVNRVALIAFGYAGSLAMGLALGVAMIPVAGTLSISLALLIAEIGGAVAAMRTLALLVPHLRLRVAGWRNVRLLSRSSDPDRS